MTSRAQSWEQEAETQFIESLRPHYEEQGFTFTAHPTAAHLPAFLGAYVPDALAQKPGHNVVIEVKRRQSSSTEHGLKKIRRLFEGHSEWHFLVVFMGTDSQPQSVTVPTATPSEIRGHIREIRLLMQQHRRPAFIMAWSLLEATLRALDGETANRPRSPGTVVQTGARQLRWPVSDN